LRASLEQSSRAAPARESVFMSAAELAPDTEKIHRLRAYHFRGASASSTIH
jgi:hypothetical protein